MRSEIACAFLSFVLCVTDARTHRCSLKLDQEETKNCTTCKHLSLSRFFVSFSAFVKLPHQVSIVNNNLGNAYTLQALELDAAAGNEINPRKAKSLLQQAGVKYSNAVVCYNIAIADAEMLCTLSHQSEYG